MQTISYLNSKIHKPPSGGESSRYEPQNACVDLQFIPAGKGLFQAGDKRNVYRVESGAISHFMQWADGRHEVVEFAFPGDLVGLGHMATHASTAHAMVDTMVSVLSPAGLEQAQQTDDLIEMKLAAAVEREFDYLRDKAINSAAAKPVHRLANYLVAISRINQVKGQAADFITDDNCSPLIAEMLHLNATAMGGALLQLRKLGLIAGETGGLRILHRDALERFADEV